MRKRIQRLAAGKFEYARPLLSFSTDKVTIEALEGKDYSGDFVITSTNRVPMRGVIYTSDPRIECLNPQFEGEEVRIRYQFHSNGLVEGDIYKGEFYIICNQGEYNLSFVASISKLYADSAIGKIKNLNDFSKLAMENYEEAYRLFYSQNFKNILPKNEAWENLLYEGLREGAATKQKIEEFLIATHKKKKITIELSDTKREIFGVKESRKETVTLRKDQWGCLDISIASDAAFLVPSKKHLTEENFLGSVCAFEYYINQEALHAGKNFGRLVFSYTGGECVLEVCVSERQPDEMCTNREQLDIQKCRMQLMQLYIDYRLKKIVTGVYTVKTVEILDHLMAMKQNVPFYSLMKAQALLLNRQRQEASWILEDFKREWLDRESPIWGYYLYICTLIEREPSYVDKLTAEIELLFHKNPKNSLLFWILLFVKEEYYRNNSRRLKAIQQWIARGNDSPYFYLEAYYLIWQDPYLLGYLNEFEIKVLNWAGKQNAISKDIAMQVMSIVPEKREFHPSICQILKMCYQAYPENEMLTVLCSYMIKGQRFTKEDHKWYALGIEQEIRITGLYEAYLMSLDERKVEAVPKMIQMYFQYNSNISYRQRAILFVNIIAAKEKQPEVYQKYRRTMEQFAMEQIELGHISDNLAVIYDEMLQRGILNEELAKRFSGILFTHRIVCHKEGIARAVILQRQLMKAQIIYFSGKVAYFQAYTDDYCVILEDNRGNFFVEKEAYEDEALMNPRRYLSTCLALAPDRLSYILFLFHDKKGWEDFSEQDSIYFSMLLQSEKVSAVYKAQLLPEIIRYYQKKTYDGINGNRMLEKYMVQVDYTVLTAEAKRYLMELLAEAHLYEKAYYMAQNFGYEYLGSHARVSLCSYAVSKAEFEEDDFLLGFVENTFLLGKYNDIMLIYLCKYYNAATKIMAEVWKASGEFEIDTFDLEERILTQMLYSTEYNPYAEQIYESYCTGGGRELICMAYLSYFSNGYLVNDAVVPEHIFPQIKQRYLEEKELNDACKLALLKHDAIDGIHSKTERDIADRLLWEYTGRNIYFAFFRQFEKELLWKYHLYDKFFVEYHTTPRKRVVLHYSMGEEEFYKEDLLEMYDGIYVKEFILFFGESVQYYISEESDTPPKVMESNCISNRDIIESEIPGKYAHLNEMLFERTLQDGEKLKRHMKNYFGMQKVSEELFEIL